MQKLQAENMTEQSFYDLMYQNVNYPLRWLSALRRIR